MGDRTWVNYSLHGTIDSFDVLLAICETVATEGIADDFGSTFKTKEQVAVYLAQGKADFTDEEANYGKIDPLEDTLKANNVWFSFSHGSGYEFGTGGGYWTPNAADDYCGDEPAIGADALRSAIEQSDTVQHIQALIARLETATGRHLPDFKISEDVIEQAKEHGLLPGGTTVRTVKAKISETVFYSFELELTPGDDPEQAALAHFTNSGPKEEWFTHCENRHVVEVAQK